MPLAVAQFSRAQDIARHRGRRVETGRRNAHGRRRLAPAPALPVSAQPDAASARVQHG